MDEGKILWIGVSNFSFKQLVKARELLKKHDLAVDQVHYNLLKRDAEKKLIPYCLKEKILLLAYSPLAQGLLTGKYGRKNMPKSFRRRLGILLYYGNVVDRLEKILTVLRKISSERNKKISQVALSRVIRHENVAAIPGAKNNNQLKINVGSVFSLTQQEISALNRV